jgi:hypothetical protein
MGVDGEEMGPVEVKASEDEGGRDMALVLE